MDEGRTFPLPVAQSLTWENRVTPAASGPASGGRATFLTIVTADRAGQARIFARSARECHPDARLVVLVAGADVPPRMFEGLYDRVIAVEELACSGLADMRFRYSREELCFALKPWALRHLFDGTLDGPIYYFDSDIELFSPLVEAEAALARGANLVLTPHILRPGPDQEREKALLRSGSFNAGFFAVAPTPAARAFIAWWCDRLRTGGTHDPLEGTYGDQKWLELAPSLCDGVTILRHPGYNFAYWNAHERELRCLGGVWTAADWPLRFVHYSRWNLREQNAEQYLARFFVGEYQPFADLFAEYRQKVHAESLSCETPDAAEPDVVPQSIRDAYARHADAIDGDAPAVLAHAAAVLDAPNPARPDIPDLPITILYDEIWQRHADLRYRFAIDEASGRIAYLRWLVETGAAKLAIPARFLGKARSALERERVRQLEAADEPTPPAIADEDAAAAEEGVARLLAARDAEQQLLRRQHDDIRLLVRANKGLRRELQSVQVRRWRDEERIAALETDLTELRQAHDSVIERSRGLAEVAGLRSGRWRRLPRWLDGTRPPSASRRGRPILAGAVPFFKRGFVLGDAAAIAGGTVRRRKDAPSGMLIFGPYIALPPGRYAAVIDARLYQRLPLFADFTIDVVHDRAQLVVALQRFRLSAIAARRRCELLFRIGDGEAAADVEIRLWARRGTPLEIAAIELYQLEPPPAAAA